MTENKIIEQIRQLLRIASDRGASINEREPAQRRAERLMVSYRIESLPEGDGTVKPAPAPAPTPTTEPTPELTPTTPAPKPTPTAPTVDKTPEPKVTTSPAPVPSREAPKPEPKADAQPVPAPTTRLAKTGAALDGIGVAPVSLLIGAALVIGGHVISHRFNK